MHGSDSETANVWHFLELERGHIAVLLVRLALWVCPRIAIAANLDVAGCINIPANRPAVVAIGCRLSAPTTNPEDTE